jgi:hypothetical protein
MDDRLPTWLLLLGGVVLALLLLEVTWYRWMDAIEEAIRCWWRRRRDDD